MKIRLQKHAKTISSSSAPGCFQVNVTKWITNRIPKRRTSFRCQGHDQDKTYSLLTGSIFSSKFLANVRTFREIEIPCFHVIHQPCVDLSVCTTVSRARQADEISWTQNELSSGDKTWAFWTFSLSQKRCVLILGIQGEVCRGGWRLASYVIGYWIFERERKLPIAIAAWTIKSGAHFSKRELFSHINLSQLTS